ncbi:monocyte to macrophage differentiation factor [Drosophila grimshawi]|uniref:GH12297 n=1 Tax=Drosophila grimshawi TaxID=7222 RepID=B4JJA1_DROGR|nr:monocyte to macrophage differentiation factor [Drosophila grimshawi]XP_032594185.1 monocyte to macrophage differentiation factor [Drosophila grimshawi]EDV99653.1 GH12297 [Drosophila grimshawi]
MNNLVQDIQNRYSFLGNLFSHVWKCIIRSNLKLKLQLRSIQWKNAKAKPGCAYQPTEIEQVANVITHGIWIVPAVFAVIKLFERSNSSSQYLVSWVYGTALCMVFTVSTFFHCSCYCAEQKPPKNYNGWSALGRHTYQSLKNVLHRCDRAMIYVFIAGSYFPWLTLENTDHSAILFCMEWIIWLMAAIGIAYQQLFHERYKCLETFFYILMGLGPALVVMLTGHHFNGMLHLKFGGAFYILGIVFFKSDGLIPMAHAIWHLFVVLAAGCHYYAILVNLYPNDANSLTNQ